MSGFDLNKELFSLNGDKSWEGKSQGRVGGGIGASASAAIEFCHGVKFDLSFEAGAQAELMVGALGAALRAQGKAYVGAGIRGVAQYETNIFESMGLRLELAAYLEASAAGSLGISLRGKKLVEAIFKDNDQFSARLAEILLKSVSIEAGVWGKASFAVSARAFLVIEGTFLPERGKEPGFLFQAGASAGWLAGSGWDLYLRMNLPEPREVYTDLTGLIIEEVLEKGEVEGRKRRIAQFSMGLGLSLLYDIAEGSVSGRFPSSNKLADDFTKQVVAALKAEFRVSLQECLRSFFGDKIGSILLMSMRGETPPEVVAARKGISDAMALLQGNFTKRKFVTMVNHVSKAAPAMEMNRAEIDHVFTIIWCANALQEDDFANPPSLVMQALKRHLNSTSVIFSRGIALEFLVAETKATLLPVAPRPVRDWIFEMENRLGIELGQLVALAMDPGDLGGFSRDFLFPKCQILLSGLLEDFLIKDLLPQLRGKLPEGAALEMCDEVLEPSFRVLNGLLTEALSDLASSTGDFQDTLNKFKKGSGSLITAAAGRSISVLGNSMMGEVLDQMHHRFKFLAAQVRRKNSRSEMLSAFSQFTPSSSNQFDVTRRAMLSACRELIGELLETGAIAFGPTVWTPARLEKQRLVTNRMLSSLPENSELSKPGGVDNYLSKMDDCSLPFFPEETKVMGDLYKAILYDEMKIVGDRVGPAVEKFFIAIGEGLANGFIDEAESIARRLKDRFVDAREDLENWRKERERQKAKLRAKIELLRNELKKLLEMFSNQKKRDAFIDRILTEVRKVINAFAPPGSKNWAYNTFAGIVRPVLNNILKSINTILTAGRNISDMSLGSLTDAGARAQNLESLLKSNLKTSLENKIGGALARLLPDTIIDRVADELVASLKTATFLRRQGEIKTAYQAVPQLEAEVSRLTGIIDSSKVVYDQADAEQKLFKRAPSSLFILSPAKESDIPLVYGGLLPVEFLVSGKSPEQLASTSFHCLINGITHPIDFSELRETRNGWLVSSRIPFSPSPLEAGINVLEIIFTNGRKTGSTSLRDTRVFLVEPAPPIRSILIDPEESSLDAPGNDHSNLTKEWVALRNVSGATVSLLGWTLKDRYGHTFQFPDFSLQAGRTLKVITGKGRNTSGKLFWNRSMAVWNNDGDEVLLLDSTHVVHDRYLYKLTEI